MIGFEIPCDKIYLSDFIKWEWVLFDSWFFFLQILSSDDVAVPKNDLKNVFKFCIKLDVVVESLKKI